MASHIEQPIRARRAPPKVWPATGWGRTAAWLAAAGLLLGLAGLLIPGVTWLLAAAAGAGALVAGIIAVSFKHERSVLAMAAIFAGLVPAGFVVFIAIAESGLVPRPAAPQPAFRAGLSTSAQQACAMYWEAGQKASSPSLGPSYYAQQLRKAAQLTSEQPLSTDLLRYAAVWSALDAGSSPGVKREQHDAQGALNVDCWGTPTP